MISGWFAKMVDRDLGKFPGHIGEVVSGFKAFQNAGWGKGFSGRHLSKIIARDETIFTTTWAELRREYFRELKAKMSPHIDDVEVPLPCGRDGKVLSDKIIRRQVQDGYRLMFCPITKIHQLIDSPLLPRSQRFCFLEFGEKDWRDEIESNLLSKSRGPHWFWVDCTERKGDADLSPNQFMGLAPTLIEYLITNFVLKEETGKPLDESGYTFLNHHCQDKQYVVLGGNQIKETPTKKISNFFRVYEDYNGSQFPIYSRLVKRNETS